MKKILGLDIGVNSIGWALIQELENDIERYSIIKMGSRIIPLNPTEADEFTKGNAISKNANRRIKRGIRRGFHRYKMRKYKLTSLLRDMAMMPDEALFKLNALELYSLRDKALNQQLSLQEIGRIFYHLNQKRGYKSNRKANNEEEAKTVASKAQSEEKSTKKLSYTDKINVREEILKERGITIGQYFYEQLQTNSYFRIKENIFLRKSYEAEFLSIWNNQKNYYPEIFTEQNLRKFFNEIIYFQRPLKSQKHLLNDCLFEYSYAKAKSGAFLLDNNNQKIIIRPKSIAKSNPLFQIAKVWQDINHLKIRDKSGVEVILTQEQKQLLFTELSKKDKLTTTELKKKLGLTPSDNYYTNLKKDLIEGNKTLSALRKVISDDNAECLQLNLIITQKGFTDYSTGELREMPVIDPIVEKEPLYRLWHLLYSIEEPEHLVRHLVNVFGFSPKQAENLSKIDFSKIGYGSISAKAYRKIIPQLMQGHTYDKACLNAGYNHSDSKTTAENLSRELLDKLPLYAKNTLRNPVVEKIINQIINLVNTIIDEETGLVSKKDRETDKFEIRVELGRELKQNAEQRNSTFSRNNKRDSEHKAIAERLKKELGFTSVSRRDIEKVKLFDEFGGISPYEPNHPVQLKELFNGNYEVEHIIPKSRLFDDSFANKTIARVALNKQKDNMTAFDFIHSLGDQKFHDYTEFVKKHHFKKDGISRTKLNYLLMPGDKIPDDFINRQMRETAYIAREVKNLLQEVSYRVNGTSGSVTDFLRETWGVNRVLQQLNFKKYKKAGQTITKSIQKSDGSIHEIEEIKKDIWSKRDDQRHHAIDALVVALTNQDIIQKLNRLNQNHATQRELKESGYKFPEPWKGFVKDVINATAQILISYKSGKKAFTKNKNRIISNNKLIKVTEEFTPRGFLHKEKVYGRIKRFEKVALNPKFDKWDKIVHQTVRTELEQRLALFNNDPKKAFSDTVKNPLPEHLKKIAVFKNEFVIRFDLDTDFKSDNSDDIVDEKIKRLVKERLEQHGNSSKEAFKNLSEHPIWLNEEKKILIKAVRCFARPNDLVPLHTNIKGNPIDFVSTRNNHHIAIYKDKEGTLQENVVTFWDALERKKNGLPIIIKNPATTWDQILTNGFDKQNILEKLPKDDWEFITSLSQNEMFVFDLKAEDLNDYLTKKDMPKISSLLYRVQTIASRDYVFRHHLETNTDDKKSGGESISMAIGKFIRIRSFQAFLKRNPIKVRLNSLGEIVKIGE